MIHPREALAIANKAFEHRLRLVQADDWSRPTPCSEWDVRALVNHVVGGNLRYSMLFQGAAQEQVEAIREVDHLGVDPIASFISTASEVLTVFSEEGALGRTVQHRSGERTGAQLLHMRVLDVAVHGWDLAVAIGADDGIAPEVVELLLELSLDPGRTCQLGAIAESTGAPTADASLQARLLEMVGRTSNVPRRAPRSSSEEIRRHA